MRTFNKVAKIKHLSCSVLLLFLLTLILFWLLPSMTSSILQYYTHLCFWYMRGCDSRVDIAYTLTPTRSSHAYCLPHSLLAILQHAKCYVTSDAT